MTCGTVMIMNNYLYASTVQQISENFIDFIKDKLNDFVCRKRKHPKSNMKEQNQIKPINKICLLFPSSSNIKKVDLSTFVLRCISSSVQLISLLARAKEQRVTSIEPRTSMANDHRTLLSIHVYDLKQPNFPNDETR